MLFGIGEGIRFFWRIKIMDFPFIGIENLNKVYTGFKELASK